MNVGDAIMASGKGGNGHFVIAVTAVGANDGRLTPMKMTKLPETKLNTEDDTANILFPTFLAEDMHGTDNIDNCGVITIINGEVPADRLTHGHLEPRLHQEWRE